MTNLSMSRAKLKFRYRISAGLVLDTALHLGGGRNPAKGTDSPILRDGFGKPYIPGSSLKGALRAAVERIVPNLKVSACGIYESVEVQKGEVEAKMFCLTPLREDHPRREAYRLLEEALGKKLEDLNAEEREKIKMNLLSDKCRLPANERITEELLVCVLDENLCEVCKAFGAPLISSTLYFHDASIKEESWIGLTQVRDGVGIDRDSGRAVDRIKYDYEIVPPQTVFNFAMTIETGEDRALGLAALVLHELQAGNVPLGGIRSRGLGRCHLEAKDECVEALDFTNMDTLKAYLTKDEVTKLTLDTFIKQHIEKLWSKQEAGHV
jgi:CRISPR-associated RAMP protein (TIGR02581 family)